MAVAMRFCDLTLPQSLACLCSPLQSLCSSRSGPVTYSTLAPAPDLSPALFAPYHLTMQVSNLRTACSPGTAGAAALVRRVHSHPCAATTRDAIPGIAPEAKLIDRRTVGLLLAATTLVVAGDAQAGCAPPPPPPPPPLTPPCHSSLALPRLMCPLVVWLQVQKRAQEAQNPS